MKKNIYSSDELDLFELSILIWNNRLKIFLITILISLMSFSYNFFIHEKKINSSSKKLFEFSLKVNPANDSQFFQFISTISAMNEGTNLNPTIMFKPTSKLDKKVVFDRFIKELLDYNELVKVLSNNPNFLQKIEKLNERDKQVELYKYAKLLTIKKNPNIESEPLTYYIKFKWPKEKEGIKILRDTLELTLVNLEEELFKELDNYFELNRFLVINRDSSRIEYLITQRQIAKKLDIQKNQIDNKSFHLINNAYYLVGYEAIDQEIEFLKKRKYIQINSIENLYLKIKNRNDHQWVEYNMLALTIKNLKEKPDQKRFPTIVIILFGLIISTIYVLISNTIENRKSLRRK